MKEFVDVEGSGEGRTVIRGSANGVLFGSNNCELRFLRVENTGDGQFASTAIITGVTDFKITHVTAIARNPGQNGQTLAMSASGTPVLTDVTAIATDTNGQAFGVAVNSDATVELINVRAIASGNNAGANRALFITSVGTTTAIARNSVLIGDPAVLNGGTANLAATQLDGAITGGGTYVCAGSYNGGFVLLNGACL